MATAKRTRDVTIVRGDTYTHVISRTEPDPQAPATGQVPMDLTGYTYTSQVRARPDEDILASFSVDTSDAANGNVTLTLSAVQTAALPVRKLSWDVQEIDPGGNVRTIIWPSTFTVLADVSRPT